MFYSPCTLTDEWFEAYDGQTWIRDTWYGNNEALYHRLLEKHKHIVETGTEVTEKLSTNPIFYLHDAGALCFEDKVALGTPEIAFISRLSSFTKTLDVVLFFKETHYEIRAIPREEIGTLENWCAKLGVTLYNAGPDPLPVRLILEARAGGESWEAILDCFAESENDSDSDWEP